MIQTTIKSDNLMEKKVIFLCAGGTGGHINAALALGEKFIQKGFAVIYLSGKRALDYKLFKDQHVLHIDASPLRFKNPFKLVWGALKNFKTFYQILFLVYQIKPKAIVGAGGYVCGPTLLAGFLLRKPVYIVEQNSVMGLTNKILGFIATKIFVHFKQTIGLKEKFKKKTVISGNPIRAKINDGNFHTRVLTNELNLFIFGGSLGALEINQLVDKLLDCSFSFNLNIRHQTGLDHEIKKAAYGKGIRYEQLKYVDDMKKEYEWCDLMITRAGASTVSELRVVQKPVVLIPYPHATDNHQETNAKFLQNEVKFKTYIHSGKELSDKNCEKIINIITQVFELSKTSPQLPAYRDTSTDNVVHEILHDIQQ